MSTPPRKRLVRPNREQFDATVAELEGQLKEAEAELEVARNGVKSSSPEGKQALLSELEQIRARQGALKAARGKVFDELRHAEDQMKKKIRDLQGLKTKSTFKNVEELDRKIQQLEQEVDAGQMRLADEKKTLGEISNLKKLRKNFGQIQELQSAVDADKALVAKLKSQLDDKDAKQLGQRYDSIQKELDAMRESQKKSLDKRRKATEKRDAVRNKLHQTKNEHYAAVRAFQDAVKAENAARIEAEKAQKQAYEKERKLKDAQEKLEAASQPAFAVQRDTAENLLLQFDPTYKRETRPLTVGGVAVKSAASSKPQREIKNDDLGQLIKRTEDVLFVGDATKGKKKAARGMRGAANNGASNNTSNNDDKLRLNLGIVEDLSFLNIPIPTKKDEVSETIQQLKTKLQYYKDNEERVTKERVERAQAEVDKLDAAQETAVADDNKENATNGSA